MILTSLEEMAQLLRQGKVLIMPSDTVLGFFALATQPEAVERFYAIKERDQDKPPVVLIHSIEDLEQFGIDWWPRHEQLARFWPGPVSVILPCDDQRFVYLHRGQASLAFRLPAVSWLGQLLAETGPLASTSANRPGETSLASVDEALQIFDEMVDGYFLPPGVERTTQLATVPSTIVRLTDQGGVELVREGVRPFAELL